jgi:hypothetical protein
VSAYIVDLKSLSADVLVAAWEVAMLDRERLERGRLEWASMGIHFLGRSWFVKEPPSKTMEQHDLEAKLVELRAEIMRRLSP